MLPREELRTQRGHGGPWRGVGAAEVRAPDEAGRVGADVPVEREQRREQRKRAAAEGAGEAQPEWERCGVEPCQDADGRRDDGACAEDDSLGEMGSALDGVVGQGHRITSRALTCATRAAWP
jgi:hypothetical protein